MLNYPSSPVSSNQQDSMQSERMTIRHQQYHPRFIGDTEQYHSGDEDGSDDYQVSMSPQMSKSIPISCKGVHRTASEIRLMEDEAMADLRDYCMYTRIMSGIDPKQSPGTWNSIIRTRHNPVKGIVDSTSCQEDLDKYAVFPPSCEDSATANQPQHNHNSLASQFLNIHQGSYQTVPSAPSPAYHHYGVSASYDYDATVEDVGLSIEEGLDEAIFALEL